ncbi:MAG TPA: hypothetical protein VMT23_01335 [Candidatus Binatia bacterium]|nr:hypothetical protein [Candidatus Binatia bacterium]
MSPEQTPQARSGDPFRDIILTRLVEVVEVEAGIIPEEPPLVTTSRGLTPLVPANADFIRSTLQDTWGQTYPELFEEYKYLGFATIDNLNQIATDEELAGGVPTRIWNVLARFDSSSTRQGQPGLFDEERKSLNLQLLKLLHEQGAIEQTPTYGPACSSFVGRLIEAAGSQPGFQVNPHNEVDPTA